MNLFFFFTPQPLSAELKELYHFHLSFLRETMPGMRIEVQHLFGQPIRAYDFLNSTRVLAQVPM